MNLVYSLTITPVAPRLTLTDATASATVGVSGSAVVVDGAMSPAAPANSVRITAPAPAAVLTVTKLPAPTLTGNEVELTVHGPYRDNTIRMPRPAHVTAKPR